MVTFLVGNCCGIAEDLTISNSVEQSDFDS